MCPDLKISVMEADMYFACLISFHLSSFC